MAQTHFKLLCELAEIVHLAGNHGSVGDLLNLIVKLVVSHLKADVCSIYLREAGNQTLHMRANVGLNLSPEADIRLIEGEGIAGTTLKEMRPICESDGHKVPYFKHIEGIDEEKYDAYLSVPIHLGETKIGVIMVQRTNNKPFQETDVQALKAVNTQVAYFVENARLLLNLHESNTIQSEPEKKEQLKIIKAKVASEGLVVAPSLVRQKQKRLTNYKNRRYREKYSLQDFKRAVTQTELQILEFQQAVETLVSDDALYIFTGHLMILHDQAFIDGIESLIQSGINPPKAVFQVADQFIKLFSQSVNQLIKEKVQDVEDISLRILSNILSEGKETKIGYSDKIVIAESIFPSDFLRLAGEGVKGFVLLHGGVTSHLSILAKSMKLPLFYVDEPRLLSLEDGLDIVLDSSSGSILIDPDDKLKEQFLQKVSQLTPSEAYIDFMKGNVLTRCEQKVELFANINLLADINAALQFNAAGVGLYRSEFPFIIRNNVPTEEEQFNIYSQLLTKMQGREVTIRTLDIGGDKILDYFYKHPENNPFLGLRSIRFTLLHRDIFLQQLRAILRAAHGQSNVRLMFPMIGSMVEWREAIEIYKEAKHSLREDELDFNDDLQLGIMVEVPSVVFLLEALAPEIKFVSIGTNDLVQYLLAVDRTNEKVARHYEPFHPAVIKTIKEIFQICQSRGVDVSVCGELAHDPLFLAYFLGLGCSKFSMDSQYLPRAKKFINTVGLGDCQRAVEKVQELSNSLEIKQVLSDGFQTAADF